MSNKKTIGILTRGFETTFGVTMPYYQYFDQFGEVVFINPLSSTVNKNIDLLVLPGGQDVSPMRYGEIPSSRTGNPNIMYEAFDVYMLQKYIDAGIPIFGICRGLQTLNVHFGGTLYQHINQEYSKMRYDIVHDVTILDNPIYVPNKRKEFGVNSIHHQAVKDVAKDMAVLLLRSKSKDESIPQNVEALYHKHLPIIGVQYHPEEINCYFASKCIEYLLSYNKKTKPEVSYVEQ
jgi:gamma-glutamyl-gamma-aminobutyrate hydrolase PuuD